MPQPLNQRRIDHTAKNASWVVVADAGRARIFSGSGAERHLEEHLDLVNPDSRLQDHDRLSDRRGHVTQAAAGIGHAFEPRETHSEHVAASFAKDLCERLDAAQRSGEVHRIYLIAAPHFLGLMRSNLGKQTEKIVVEAFALDLSRHPVDAIRDALPAYL